MEEMSPVIALPISVGNPLQDRNPMEMNCLKLMTDAVSMLSDPIESEAEVATMEVGEGGDDLEVRTLPGSDEEDSMSVGPEQSPESSSSVIIDRCGVASVLEEISALDAADTAAIVVPLDMMQSIAPDVEIIAGDSASNLVTSDVTYSDLKVAAALVEPPAVHGGGAFLPSYVPLWGCISICGRRPEMEDAAVALPWFWEIPARMLTADCSVKSTSVGLSPLPAHFFGVYDGHGGAQVANYCRGRLHLAFIEEIESVNRSFGDDSGDDWKKHWEMAFTDCFLKVDDEVGGKGREVAGSTLDVSEEESGSSLSASMPSKSIAPETVGSTAVVAVICTSHIIIANCGDSRAVLCRGKEPMALSVDHKPNRDDEYARIEAAGGKVIQWNSYRVLGVLAMSRSIGMYALPRQAINVQSGKIRTENACFVIALLA